MNLSLKRSLAAAAAVATGTIALLGAAAGTAEAGGRAHCDRAERPVWSEGPSRNMTARGCSLPSRERRWYRVEVDTLVQPRQKTDYVGGGVVETKTVHDRTIRCLGYTSGSKGTVNWFGCVPH
ncbi:hypothetical protein JK359_04250 [Streptomyces actinomycinicus]|uniref:Secreted protein n=1 Tax=Streptomyces actinomycinicus TaxID=1695166 RepID=A0A937EF60_9ACTN|nr:hypothetical protein [Streptomyces actinomycinicus]MBL1081195.1 hypothetical protein [Streptomyces actinomycinicus]